MPNGHSAYLCMGDKKDIIAIFCLGLNCRVLITPKGVYIINAKHCISSTRSVVYHQAAGKLHADA